MRERRKLNGNPSGSACSQTRKWVYYDAMEFLSPHVMPRQSSSNVPTPPDEDNCHATEDAPKNSTVTEPANASAAQEVASNFEIGESSSTVEISLPTPKKPSVTKKRRRDSADEMDIRLLDELKQLREQACPTNETDPDRQFLLSILPMMKQLSPSDNINIKIEIYEVFRRKPFQPTHSVQYGYYSDYKQSSNDSVNYSEYTKL
ncbi:hypothetical protein Pcinc_015148 [Petrolisthes cinctipes]|uniref:BESS domain-containing protein n=1 Tax=Petrolisthes cinctipes TaxID=88211 RepID=A0AAE1FWF5_PETCI|nr:hypothetical protein Pcinc_015148 [Petrolisthes cinctipes]